MPPTSKKTKFSFGQKTGHLSAFSNTLQWNWIFTAVYWKRTVILSMRCVLFHDHHFPGKIPKSACCLILLPSITGKSG